MKERGQIQSIGAIAIIGIAIFVTIFFVIPSTGGSAPKVPGLTEDAVFADVQVDTYVGGLGDKGIEISSVTTETRTVPMKMLGAWFPSYSFKGVIIVKTINNGQEIGKQQQNIEDWAHFWDVETTSRTFADLRLGNPGDGDVKIKASLYDKDGNLLTSVHTFRSI